VHGEGVGDVGETVKWEGSLKSQIPIRAGVRKKNSWEKGGVFWFVVGMFAKWVRWESAGEL